MPSKTLIALASQNKKLGPGVSATYRPVGETCPKCPLAEECYAKRGHTALVAKRSSSRSDDMWQMIGSPLVRHVVSGDFFKQDAIGRARFDWEYWLASVEFHERSGNSEGWGYSHNWRQWPQEALDMCPDNLTVLASCDTLEEAREAQSHGWRTARTTTDLADKQDNEDVCPVDATKQRGKPPTTNCARCRKCWESEKNILFKIF